MRTYQEHVPLPHVFPPFAIRQSPTGRATLGSRTLSDVASLCHSLRWCKKSQRTRNFVLSSGARRSLPRRHCSSRSVFEKVSAFIRTHRTSKVRAKYNFLLARNITGEANNYTSKQLPPTNSRMMELQGITLSSSRGRKYLRYLMRRFATTY